jgi:hypothetical protein
MEKENLDEQNSNGIKPDVKQSLPSDDWHEWRQKKGWKETVSYCRYVGEDGDGCPQFEYKSKHEVEEEYETEKRIEARFGKRGNVV